MEEIDKRLYRHDGLIVNEEDPANISCSVVGYPEPDVKWLKGNIEIGIFCLSYLMLLSSFHHILPYYYAGFVPLRGIRGFYFPQGIQCALSAGDFSSYSESNL